MIGGEISMLDWLLFTVGTIVANVLAALPALWLFMWLVNRDCNRFLALLEKNMRKAVLEDQDMKSQSIDELKERNVRLESLYREQKARADAPMRTKGGVHPWR